MTANNAFNDFLRSRRLSGCTPATVKSYKCHIGALLRFLGEETEMEDITQEDIEDFIEGLYDSNLASNTIATYIRNAKIFLRWYEKKHDVGYEANEIPVPRAEKKLVHIYTPEETTLIFDTIKGVVPWLTLRDKAMVALMLDSGIRQRELCGLKRIDVDFALGRIKVMGKGNRERYAPLGGTAARMLREYLDACPHQLDVVFASYAGEPLTCNAVKCMTWHLQSLLPFDFSSHKLRHNFATNYLINQYRQVGYMDIYKLMAIMGHLDIKTTQRYLHIANSILAVESCISQLDTNVYPQPPKIDSRRN